MFKPEDYELPLQKSFQLNIINKDIDNCNDIDVLKQSLKDSIRLYMNYQQLLTVSVKGMIMQDLKDWSTETDKL
tara:strand:- start:294 stop:515 length:222 start_codon:yes stop_codon:yes gene_type:complete